MKAFLMCGMLGVMMFLFIPKQADASEGSKEEIFQKALEFVLRWEGGYVDHPADSGGATNQGVTQRTYDCWRDEHDLPHQSVKEITDNEVAAIYRGYWEDAHCDEIAHFSNRLAIAQFDWAVNAGPRRAMKTLQHAVGSTSDGIWGSNTRIALYSSDSEAVLQRYLDHREKLYLSWGDGDQSVFLKGWLNRLRDLDRFLTQYQEVHYVSTQ